MRVLVVSQDAQERARASSALGLRPDVVVEQVATAQEAHQRILDSAESFDVLIVDGDLQPRGGFALLYDLRSHAELTGSAPIASVVMASRQQDQWLARWSGTNVMLVKPVDPFELARLVDRLPSESIPDYGDAGSASAQVGAMPGREQ